MGPPHTHSLSLSRVEIPLKGLSENNENCIKIGQKSWPLCRKPLIFGKRAYKPLKGFFSEKVRIAFLRNDEMLIVSKLHQNRTEIMASMQETPLFLKKGHKNP